MSAHLTRTTMLKRRSVGKRGCRVGYAGRFMPVSVLRLASAAVVGEHSAMGHMGGLPKASALFVSGATTAAQTLSFQIRTLPTAAVAVPRQYHRRSASRFALRPWWTLVHKGLLQARGSAISVNLFRRIIVAARRKRTSR